MTVSHQQAPRSKESMPGILVALILLCTLVETVLQCADLGLIPFPRLRNMAYENGAFWTGLTRSWVPNFAAQPYVMFISYGFLHAGILHLCVNMITLWALGRAVIHRVGSQKFSLLYLVSLVGAAAGYAILARTPAPMVGASGALFGLAAALLAWTYIDRFTLNVSLMPILQAALLLISINVVMYWALGGQIAWQTHLAGAITGWITAIIIDPTHREENAKDF